jgi:hypothetical protein
MPRSDSPERSTSRVPRLHALRGLGDEVLDLSGRPAAPLREVAHLLRHHGEAPPLLPGARRLHGGVQGEQAGLEGDLVDHADDVRDAPAAVVDLRHRLDRLGDDLPATLGLAQHLLAVLARDLRVLRVLLHGAGDLLHARGGLLEGRRLLLGSPAEVLVALRHPRGALIELAGGAPDRRDDSRQVVQRDVDLAGQLAELALEVPVHAVAEVLLREVPRTRETSRMGSTVVSRRRFTPRASSLMNPLKRSGSSRASSSPAVARSRRGLGRRSAPAPLR